MRRASVRLAASRARSPAARRALTSTTGGRAGADVCGCGCGCGFAGAGLGGSGLGCAGVVEELVVVVVVAGLLGDSTTGRLDDSVRGGVTVAGAGTGADKDATSAEVNTFRAAASNAERIAAGRGSPANLRSIRSAERMRTAVSRT